jgi:hypothetical protein
MKQLGKNQVWIGTEPLESLVIYFFFTETEDKSPLLRQLFRTWSAMDTNFCCGLYFLVISYDMGMMCIHDGQLVKES